MSTELDNVTIKDSMKGADALDYNVEQRRSIYIGDNNGTNYTNGELLFDLQSMASNNQYIDWSQSYLDIPLVLDFTTDTA